MTIRKITGERYQMLEDVVALTGITTKALSTNTTSLICNDIVHESDQKIWFQPDDED